MIGRVNTGGGGSGGTLTVREPVRKSDYDGKLYANPALEVSDLTVSGGTLAACLEDGIRRYGAGRLALDLERLRLDFTLPHSANVRRPLTASELRRLREGKSVYFSEELCARYFTYRTGSENHYVLFDDAQTLRKKAALAENRGIREGFFMLPEVADIAGELLG